MDTSYFTYSSIHRRPALFLDHLGLEPNLVNLINNLLLAYFSGIVRDLSFFFRKINGNLFHTVKPLQGFFYDQRS